MCSASPLVFALLTVCGCMSLIGGNGFLVPAASTLANHSAVLEMFHISKFAVCMIVFGVAFYLAGAGVLIGRYASTPANKSWGFCPCSNRAVASGVEYTQMERGPTTIVDGEEDNDASTPTLFETTASRDQSKEKMGIGRPRLLWPVFIYLCLLCVCLIVFSLLSKFVFPKVVLSLLTQNWLESDSDLQMQVGEVLNCSGWEHANSSFESSCQLASQEYVSSYLDFVFIFCLSLSGFMLCTSALCLANLMIEFGEFRNS
jgi:hypothetical protein